MPSPGRRTETSQEVSDTQARLELHPIVKEPHWIPYDAATTSLLEKNYQSGAGTVVLSAAYHADTKKMTQTNVRTNFSRKLLRFEPPVSKGAAPPIKPDGIAADEPCLVLEPGAMMLIAKQRDDGWAFGSVVMEAEAMSPSSPGPGWSKTVWKSTSELGCRDDVRPKFDFRTGRRTKAGSAWTTRTFRRWINSPISVRPGVESKQRVRSGDGVGRLKLDVHTQARPSRVARML